MFQLPVITSNPDNNPTILFQQVKHLFHFIPFHLRNPIANIIIIYLLIYFFISFYLSYFKSSWKE